MKEKSTRGQMDGKYFFLSSIIQLHNLVHTNCLNVDTTTASNDIWTEIVISVNKWHVVIPNTIRDINIGIICTLHHGITLHENSRKILHCSMMGDEGHSSNVYGIFVGIEK